MSSVVSHIAVQLMVRHVRELKALLKRCQDDPECPASITGRIWDRLKEAESALQAMRKEEP